MTLVKRAGAAMGRRSGALVGQSGCFGAVWTGPPRGSFVTIVSTELAERRYLGGIWPLMLTCSTLQEPSFLCETRHISSSRSLPNFASFANRPFPVRCPTKLKAQPSASSTEIFLRSPSKDSDKEPDLVSKSSEQHMSEVRIRQVPHDGKGLPLIT